MDRTSSDEVRNRRGELPTHQEDGKEKDFDEAKLCLPNLRAEGPRHEKEGKKNNRNAGNPPIQVRRKRAAAFPLVGSLFSCAPGC